MVPFWRFGFQPTLSVANVVVDVRGREISGGLQTQAHMHTLIGFDGWVSATPISGRNRAASSRPTTEQRLALGLSSHVEPKISAPRA